MGLKFLMVVGVPSRTVPTLLPEDGPELQENSFTFLVTMRLNKMM